MLAAAVLLAVWRLVRFIHAEVGWAEVGHVFVLGCYTLVRVLVLIALAALVWVPVGVWIGMNPRWAGAAAGGGAVPRGLPGQPDVPGGGACSSCAGTLNPDIWLSPLMVLGTQWYLLFNVIAGASTDPDRAALRGAATWA